MLCVATSQTAPTSVALRTAKRQVLPPDCRAPTVQTPPLGRIGSFPIWVATHALRQRIRIIRFGTAAEILDFSRLFKDGKRYHRFMEGFQRIFAATIFFGTTDQPDGRLLLDWARLHFFDGLTLWLAPQRTHDGSSAKH